jgi:hypothetical protein
VTDALDTELVRDLAEAVVDEVAPEEAPIFSALADAYVKDPERALSQLGGGGDPLGFGIDSAVVMMTPVAMLVAAEVVRHLSDQLLPPVVGRGKRAVERSFRRLLRRSSASDIAGEEAPVRLTTDQLAQVRRIAVEKARQAGVSKDKADLIADALVGSFLPADEGRGR